MAISLISNNDDFIVLNKSAGISVQGGTKSKKNLIDIFAKSEVFKNTKQSFQSICFIKF